MVCYYCNESADDASMDSKIRCMGPCEQFIHINCVGLSKAAAKAFNDCNEIHFYCNKCQKYSLCGISETLRNFSKDINKLGDALKPLAEVDFNKLTTSFINNRVHPNVTIRPPKRLRIDMEPEQPNQIISTEKIGTKESDILSVVPKPKSLVIGRLSKATTTDNIAKYVVDNIPDLSTADINCTMLIPKNRNADELNHINFRVTVPDRIFDQVFNASFWPKGVIVREYIFRPRTPRTFPEPVTI